MMGRLMEMAREKAEYIENQKDMAIRQAYYEMIMQDQNCSMEEAIRISIEDPAARIGLKMKEYGLRNLATKKGRRKFRDTQLDPEEIEVWDSPERPDNIAKLLAVATVETTKQVRVKVKEMRRK